MRPIDADELAKEIGEEIDYAEELRDLQANDSNINGYICGLKLALAYVHVLIDDDDSIDMVPVVHCIDCMHFAGEGMYCDCDMFVHSGQNNYCYYGEREGANSNEVD